VIGGQGGQAPIFYNLLVAFSVLLTTRLPALTRRNGLTPILVNGVVACGVLGAAILMKYTAAIEGAFIDHAHLWTLRRAGRSWGETAICGVPLALAGLAPRRPDHLLPRGQLYPDHLRLSQFTGAADRAGVHGARRGGGSRANPAWPTAGRYHVRSATDDLECAEPSGPRPRTEAELPARDGRATWQVAHPCVRQARPQPGLRSLTGRATDLCRPRPDPAENVAVARGPGSCWCAACAR
jgi:hypothetical protein